MLSNKARKLFKYLVKRLRSSVPRNRRVGTSTKRSEWSIGLLVGESPFHFAAPTNVPNPVLKCADMTDVRAAYIADPFMIRSNNVWHMFFEIVNQDTAKGEIGLARSEDGLMWSYQQLVLAEPFHLSYPYVFAWKNTYYMIPETYQANAVRLYQAMDFPTRWSYVATLLTGRDFVDSSIVRFHDTWWLFTGLGRLPLRADTLRLFYAKELLGPWSEHPLSPIIENNACIARPGGRVLKVGGNLVRYTQDCVPQYGTRVRAFEITHLTTTHYHEREVGETPVLGGSGSGWNASGMHHIDPHRLDDGRWIACVDGWCTV